MRHADATLLSPSHSPRNWQRRPEESSPRELDYIREPSCSKWFLRCALCLHVDVLRELRRAHRLLLLSYTLTQSFTNFEFEVSVGVGKSQVCEHGRSLTSLVDCSTSWRGMHQVMTTEVVHGQTMFPWQTHERGSQRLVEPVYPRGTTVQVPFISVSYTLGPDVRH
ncbi:hypothetical protein BKA93DRAFT_250223 [Sparassis latifolia]